MSPVLAIDSVCTIWKVLLGPVEVGESRQHGPYQSATIELHESVRDLRIAEAGRRQQLIQCASGHDTSLE